MRLRLAKDDVRLLPAGLLLVTLIARADLVLGPEVVLVGFLVVPVFLLYAVASVRVTAVVAAVTVLVTALLSTTNAAESARGLGRAAGGALRPRSGRVRRVLRDLGLDAAPRRPGGGARRGGDGGGRGPRLRRRAPPG